MKYAKLVSETEIDANPPRYAVIDGNAVCGELPADYLATLGFLPYDEKQMPEPVAGYHFEARYAVQDGRVVRNWAQVQDPPPGPRSLSKVKLMRALKARSLWLSVKAFIEASEDYADEWALSTTLDEDNALIVSAVAALKVSLGLTDGQVEEILAASVAWD